MSPPVPPRSLASEFQVGSSFFLKSRSTTAALTLSFDSYRRFTSVAPPPPLQVHRHRSLAPVSASLSCLLQRCRFDCSCITSAPLASTPPTAPSSAIPFPPALQPRFNHSSHASHFRLSLSAELTTRDGTPPSPKGELGN